MASDALARGRDALGRGAWEEARASFGTAVEVVESAEAWEGLSWAAWWLSDGEQAIAARERAYRLYKDGRDLRGAARMALWIADDQYDFRGEPAVASGWFARAERLLAQVEPSPEHGWLAALQAQRALDAGDTATAKRLGARARAMGHQSGLTALEMLGLATEGLSLVTEGAVDEGMRYLDEATAAALSGEFEELVPVCWTCCYLIYACERVRDFDRAGQWCRRVEDYGTKMRIDFVSGVCRAHYAAVLTWRGDWSKAEDVLEDARRALASSRPLWVREATARLGELRRRQGRFEEAAEIFAGVGSHPIAILGAAELVLDGGQPDQAIPLATRLLRQLPAENRTERAAALEILVRAHAALGDATAAAGPLEELRATAAAVRTDPLRAALAYCAGVTARAAGERERARAELEDAVTLYDATGAPYEEARARLELAGCLAELGDHAAAIREAEAAQAALAELGAAAEVKRALRVLGGLGRDRSGPLSRREVEVLRLVSDGLTDQAIAESLALSAHTVHRHVANIYTKLDCSSRAAAVAKAGRLGLL